MIQKKKNKEFKRCNKIIQNNNKLKKNKPRKIYNLKPKEFYPTRSNNYIILGYDSNNIIYNMGGSLLILEIYILIMPIIILLRFINQTK